MNERDALLRAICESPDEDTPRLVFADWLDERGQPERAEFIRLQVRFAALHRFAAGGAEEVRSQERAIWAEHQAAFRAELPQVGGVTWFPEFHRGFVEHATASTETPLVRHADAIFDRVPVQHLVVNRFNGADGFAKLPYLRRLKTLKLRVAEVNDAVVRGLTAPDQFNDTVLVFLVSPVNAPPGLRDELVRCLGHRVRV